MIERAGIQRLTGAERSILSCFTHGCAVKTVTRARSRPLPA